MIATKKEVFPDTRISKVWYGNRVCVFHGDTGILSWWIKTRSGTVRHNLEGPAVEYPNGARYWWIYGKIYTEKEYCEQLEVIRKMEKNDNKINSLPFREYIDYLFGEADTNEAKENYRRRWRH